MTTWIKPAVAWGILDTHTGMARLEQVASYDREFMYDCKRGDQRWVRVALVPLTVARKAGLLRRPR